MSTKRGQMIKILFVLLLVQAQGTSAFLSWFFGSKQTENSGSADPQQNENEVVGSSFMAELRAKKMNFDVKTTDEKFISDMTVKEMKSLSPLDGCYHQVMTRLRRTCSNLNEEQVSKIAVQLLNCQLETEKRPTFTCNDDMTLAECTKSMDPTVWNSYQIVSNRARAVCYSIRQQQFRWKSEMAVNQLMHSTVEQLNAMKDLKDGQETVAQATSSVLRKMYEGQQDLMVGHQSLKEAHSDVHQYVADNLKELTREKALIATGNKELAELIDQIRTKMDDATHQLLEQQEDTQQNHEEVLKDLSEIRSKAREVWEKIDKSSRHVLHFHNETTEQYKRTLDNLEKVNNTINYVLSSVNSMQSGIDTKLKWLTELLGGTDDKLAFLSVGAIHMVYFLLAALSASFLQTPWITRLIVMIVVPLNALSEIRQGVSLDFSAMTLFILFSGAASWFSQYLARATRPRLHIGLIKPGDDMAAPSTPYRAPHTSPTSPIFTQMVPPVVEQPGLSDSDLKKLARTLKGYLKDSRASSTCASTPLNLSRISTDSAIGTPNQLDDTTCTDASKLEITQDVHLPKANEVSGDMTESISCLDGTEDLSTSRMTEGNMTQDVLERTDIMDIRPELDIVRRQLMQTLTGGEPPSHASRSRNVNKSLPSSRTATPTRSSRNATPVRGQGSRSHTPVRCQTPINSSRVSSRPGTPSKPFCQALTNAGQPCKNRCTSTESYCHVHIVKNSDSRPTINQTRNISTLNTSNLTKSFTTLNQGSFSKSTSGLETTQDFNETEVNVTH
ncbi:protein brambleberry-like [Lineus longissimus]|uniref:protein brambleberry-like n=1 Tax=Lineus longissimus TaxID=88925 RepID=UPI00315D8FBB